MKKAINYIVTMVIGAILVIMVFWVRGGFEASDKVLIFRFLCDGYFAAGGLLTMIGVLTFATNEGAIDMLKFGAMKFVGSLLPFGSKFREMRDKRYCEYVEERGERRKTFLHFVISGVFYLVIAFVMLGIYFHFEG